jgi:hypothetical protein
MIRPGVYDDRYSAVDAAMKGVMALARTIAVPREFPAIRVPSYPELKRTAVLPFTRTGNVSVQTASVAAVAIRNPIYPVWFESTAPVNTATSYWLEGASLGAGGAPAFSQVIGPEYWTMQGGRNWTSRLKKAKARKTRCEYSVPWNIETTWTTSQQQPQSDEAASVDRLICSGSHRESIGIS